MSLKVWERTQVHETKLRVGNKVNYPTSVRSRLNCKVRCLAPN